MSAIGDCINDLKVAIETTGIPVVLNPDEVLAFLVDNPVVAFIGIATANGIGVSPVIDVEIPVYLGYRPPGGFDDVQPAYEVIPSLISICGSSARPGRFAISDLTFPSFNLIARQSVRSD